MSGHGSLNGSDKDGLIASATFLVRCKDPIPGGQIEDVRGNSIEGGESIISWSTPLVQIELRAQEFCVKEVLKSVTTLLCGSISFKACF